MTARLLKLGLGVATLLALTGLVRAESVTTSFVLVNDVYEMDEAGGQGGFPRLAAVIKAERAKNPNTVVVNAGDLISPSVFSGFDKGEHMIVFANMIGTDVMAPGNHEYDFGTDVAWQRMGESNFPWIAANITGMDGSAVPGLAKSLVKDIGGVKIGFVGLAQEETAELSTGTNLTFTSAFDAAKAESKALREAGAEFVVAINHNTRPIAETILTGAGVDLVLNGHNHDLWMLYTGKSAAMESQSDARQIAIADITFNISEKDGKRSVSWSPAFRVVASASVTPDPEVTAKVAEYKGALDKELAVEVGSTAIELDSRKPSVRGMETTMGDVIADALKAAMGADVAITNGGGIRGDKVYPAGTVLTRGDILKELPFGNKTVMVEVTGQVIKDALENGVSKIEEQAGRFPQVSGLSFTVDKAQAAGSRVSDILVNGAPLDLAATYKLATNDYMLGGGDGYTMLKSGKLLVNAESAKLIANDVMAYVKAQGGIKDVGPARITLK